MMPDPVYQQAGKWYFTDEKEGGRIGPFETEAGARAAFAAYTEAG